MFTSRLDAYTSRDVAIFVLTTTTTIRLITLSLAHGIACGVRIVNLESDCRGGGGGGFRETKKYLSYMHPAHTEYLNARAHAPNINK